LKFKISGPIGTQSLHCLLLGHIMYSTAQAVQPCLRDVAYFPATLLCLLSWRLLLTLVLLLTLLLLLLLLLQAAGTQKGELVLYVLVLLLLLLLLLLRLLLVLELRELELI